MSKENSSSDKITIKQMFIDFIKIDETLKDKNKEMKVLRDKKKQLQEDITEYILSCTDNQDSKPKIDFGKYSFQINKRKAKKKINEQVIHEALTDRIKDNVRDEIIDELFDNEDLEDIFTLSLKTKKKTV
jgi:hypothetical protein